MTLPDERYYTIVQTRKFLMELTSPLMTPRVPRVVRHSARNLLKHFPNDYVLEMMNENMPEYFAKEREIFSNKGKQ